MTENNVPPENPGEAFEPTTLEEAEVYHHAYKIGRDMWDKHQSFENTQIQQRVDEAEALATQETERANQAEEAVNQDEKSGLATEKRWREELSHSIETLGEDEEVVAMVGDLNGFKAVNDKLGHDAGDRLLGIVGEASRRVFKRESDLVARGTRDASAEEKRGDIARLGGDEFGFLVKKSKPSEDDSDNRHTSAEAMIETQAKRLNAKVAELTKGTEFEEFNVSMALGGVAYDPDIDRTPMDTFVRADAKMFEVKYKNKIDRITADDKTVLQKIIPYLEGLGARVEDWLKEAAYKEEPLS